MMILAAFAIVVNIAFAAETHQEIFEGEAREDGKLVYIEKHKVTFDDKNVALEATTDYVTPEGQPMAHLQSDFRQSANLPEHRFEDLRTGNAYGIRRVGEKIFLFQKDKDGEEKTKEIEAPDQDQLQVGCQGFNYYLKGRLNQIKGKKTIPVLFMIPGELTTYHFKLIYEKENADGTVSFTIKIQNWLLRLVAPELKFRYDTKIDRIVWYEGLSNVKNERGKMMHVVIVYKYTPPQIAKR